MRVFMCTAGTFGFCGWAMSEMPEAQKRGSSSAPGICLRNSGANSPNTVEVWTPTFSNTRPAIRLMTPPPPGLVAGVIGALPRRPHEVPGRAVGRAARLAGRSASSFSKAAQISSRSSSNQARARAFRVSRLIRRERSCVSSAASLQ